MAERTNRDLLHLCAMDKLCLTAFFALVLILAACAPFAPTSAEPTVQPALPTPTLEPTFTPSPTSSATPEPSPTTTPAEPTPTPTPQSLLSGRILDQDTDQPIAGANVSVGAATATTDADGRYTLAGLPPGQYVLSVTYPGYDPGLSGIFILEAGQPLSLDLTLYPKDTSPYPKDPMLTNPLDPAGAPTEKDAERLARLQGLVGEVTKIEETKLRGAYLVNYKRGGEVRAAVASLDHDAWALTDAAGQTWWVIKVCGNLARLVPTDVAIATPQPRSLPPLAEVLADGVSVRACASETCAAVGTLAQGKQVEVFGCLADGGWCQVGLSGGKKGWCTGKSLRQLAVAAAMPVVQAILPTAIPESPPAKEGKIAFASDRDGNEEIYTMNADGSGQTRLTDNPELDWGPVWSPNGQQIAFISHRDGNNEIYVMNADGSSQTRLTDNPASDCCLAWSPNGEQIAFVSVGDSTSGIFIMNADGSGQTHLTDGDHPSWSPDSRRIAFASIRDGNSDIYMANIDGGSLTRLTDHPDFDFGPAWSPDGLQIVFSSDRDDPRRPEDIYYPYQLYEVYVMNADGSGQKRLTYDTGGAPAWSPNSQQIAFTSRQDQNFEIFVMKADGSEQTRLTYYPGDERSLRWSPDGRQIVFSSDRDGKGQIYVMNVDGGAVTRLTFDGVNSVPDWSRR